MRIKNKSWIILFGGLGREKIIFRLLKEKIKIDLIVIGKNPNRKFDKIIKNFKKLNLKVVIIKKDELNNLLKNFVDANLLSIGFPYIIAEKIFVRHKIAINIHPTLLPKYRGPTSAAYVLINNEKQSGSTVHYIDKEVDKGDIIAQSKIKISKFDTYKSLKRKVYDTEPDLIIKSIHNIHNGIRAIKQDENLASTYLKIRKPDDSKIDPKKPLIELFDEIRAADVEDFPSFFIYNNEKIYIKLWRKNKSENEEDMI